MQSLHLQNIYISKAEIKRYKEKLISVLVARLQPSVSQDWTHPLYCLPRNLNGEQLEIRTISAKKKNLLLLETERYTMAATT